MAKLSLEPLKNADWEGAESSRCSFPLRRLLDWEKDWQREWEMDWQGPQSSRQCFPVCFNVVLDSCARLLTVT